MRILFLVFFISINLISETFIANNGRGLTFRMEKLDEQTAVKWWDLAKNIEDANQEFLSHLGPYNASFSGSRFSLTFAKSFPSSSPFYDYAIRKLIGDDEKTKSARLRAFHIGIYDGISNFRRVVENFTALNKDFTDVWVAYVGRDGAAAFSDPNDATNKTIEMMVTVMIPRDIPITIHMGIARNFFNVVNDKQTPQISTELHGFAAKAAMMLYPNQYRAMVTTPSDAMKDILVKAGLDEGDIAVGRNTDSARVLQDKETYDSDYRFRILSKDRQSEMVSLDKSSVRRSISMLHLNDPIVVDLTDLQKLFSFNVVITL